MGPKRGDGFGVRIGLIAAVFVLGAVFLSVGLPSGFAGGCAGGGDDDGSSVAEAEPLPFDAWTKTAMFSALENALETAATTVNFVDGTDLVNDEAVSERIEGAVTAFADKIDKAKSYWVIPNKEAGLAGKEDTQLVKDLAPLDGKLALQIRSLKEGLVYLLKEQFFIEANEMESEQEGVYKFKLGEGICDDNQECITFLTEGQIRATVASYSLGNYEVIFYYGPEAEHTLFTLSIHEDRVALALDLDTLSETLGEMSSLVADWTYSKPEYYTGSILLAVDNEPDGKALFSLSNTAVKVEDAGCTEQALHVGEETFNVCFGGPLALTLELDGAQEALGVSVSVGNLKAALLAQTLLDELNDSSSGDDEVAAFAEGTMVNADLSGLSFSVSKKQGESLYPTAFEGVSFGAEESTVSLYNPDSRKTQDLLTWQFNAENKGLVDLALSESTRTGLSTELKFEPYLTVAATVDNLNNFIVVEEDELADWPSFVKGDSLVFKVENNDEDYVAMGLWNGPGDAGLYMVEGDLVSYSAAGIRVGEQIEISEGECIFGTEMPEYGLPLEGKECEEVPVIEGIEALPTL